MIGCDLVNAATLASIPTAAALGRLTLAHVYVAALVSAIAFVWFDAARFGALPAIVGRGRVVAANSAVESAWGVITVVAPAVGAALAATLGAPTALWVDAASYLVSAVALACIPRPFGSPAPVQAGRRLVRRLLRDIGEGLRFVRGYTLIWPLTATGFGLSVTSGAVLGLLVVYGVRQLGLAENDARLGWLYSAGAAGALAAALALPRLSRRLPQPRLTLLGLTANVLLLGGVALSVSLPAALPLILAWQGTFVLVVINGIALRQRLTPDRLQGRVNVTARMIAWGGQPFGAALGGLLADVASIRSTYLIMALGVGVSAAFGWRSPLRGADRATVSRLVAQAEQPPEPV